MGKRETAHLEGKSLEIKMELLRKNCLLRDFEPARTLGVVAVSMGFLVILLGKITPDERLYISEIPLNTVFVLIVGLYCFALSLPKELILLLCIWSIPLHIILITTLWSGDVESGMYKYVNLMASTGIAFVLFFDSIQRFGIEYVNRVMGAVLAVLLFVAVLYKIKYGFFSRSVSFFLSGPIVFGRLMGIATIVFLLNYKGIAKYLGSIIFIMAVAWTQSRAPVVFILGVFFLLIVFEFSNKERMWLFILFFSVIAGILILVPFDTIARFFGRFAALYELATSVTEHTSSAPEPPGGGEDVSAAERLAFYMYSAQVIAFSPLGVGLGGWATALPNDFRLNVWYPHNFFFEIFSEGGLLIGSIASLPFVLFLFSREKSIFYIGLFLFLAQQTSGSLLDARYLLFFSLLSVATPYFRSVSKDSRTSKNVTKGNV